MVDVGRFTTYHVNHHTFFCFREGTPPILFLNMYPENQWLVLDVFPIEIVPF